MPGVQPNDSPDTVLALLGTLQARDDPAAWQEFVFVYGGLARRWLRGWGLQDADIEDVWQQILLDAYRGIRTYHPRPGSRFRSWLKKLAWHAMIRDAKKRGRQVSGSGSTTIHVALHAVPDTRGPAPPKHAAIQDQLERAMARVRQRVSENEWAAFSQFHFGGLSGAKVAKTLGMTVASVHSACSKVRVMLRQAAPDA